MAVVFNGLDVLVKRKGVHDAVVLFAQCQRTVLAEVSVGLRLRNLAARGKSGQIPSPLAPLGQFLFRRLPGLSAVYDYSPLPVDYSQQVYRL